MRLELKTENQDRTKSISHIIRFVFFLSVIITLCDIALKLDIISKQYRIEYNCSLLSVEKSALYFKKLSKLSDLKSKQKIWEFCREVIK